MSALIYFISLPVIYLLSLLPFPLLYLFSDFVFFLFYYVIGYRKDVVTKNLTNAFPEKSSAEIASIRKAFFKYLCDLFIETFKTLTISKKQMLRHCYFNEASEKMLAELYEQHQSVILVLGHYGNWEWAGNSFSLLCKQKLHVIYHPLRNTYFDGLMYRMRSRFGTGLIPMKQTFKAMLANRKEVTATAFIADQTPQPDNAYWTMFLNQETPVFKGTEVIARKLNLPIVYVNVKRVRRGFYELSAELLVATPGEMADGEISKLHTKRLEQDIIEQPEIWLWSHKRWKHKRPA